jgi:spermidine synthase
MRAMFSWIAPYIAAIPTFPTGLCSFVAGGLASRQPTVDPRRAKTIAAHCRYYNDHMQSGAFCLPGYVQRIFNPV